MSKFGVNFTVSNASLEEALSGIGVDHPYSNFAGGFLEVEAESVDQAREIVAKLVFEATGVAPDLGETFCTSELTCPDCGQIVSVLRHQTQRRTMKIPVLAGPQVDEGYRGRYGQH
jgi:hypothetical protein